MKRTVLTLAAAMVIGLAAAGQAGACSIDANGKLSKKPGTAYPAARDKAWYKQGKPLTLDGDSFGKTGAPRVFGDAEFSYIKKVGEMEGVAIYRDDDLPDTVFVPIDAAACTFHAYEKR